MQKRLTIVGTVRMKRRAIPRKMLPTVKGRGLLQRIPVFWRRRVAGFIRAETKQGGCSDLDVASRREGGHRRKGEIGDQHTTKSGVDILDKLIRTYSACQKGGLCACFGIY